METWAYLLRKPHPQGEEHDIEQVLEQVLVKKSKPRRMKLYEQRDGGYARDIKEVNAEPSEGDEPCLLPPSALCSQQQAEPDKRLLQCRATPYDAHRTTGGETDDMVVGHICRITEERYYIVHSMSDMLRHHLKRRGDIPMVP